MILFDDIPGLEKRIQSPKSSPSKSVPKRKEAGIGRLIDRLKDSGPIGLAPPPVPEVFVSVPSVPLNRLLDARACQGIAAKPLECFRVKAEIFAEMMVNLVKLDLDYVDALGRLYDNVPTNVSQF